MAMQILFYQANHRAENRIMQAMQANGYGVVPFSCPLQSDENIAQFRPLIIQLVHEKNAAMIYSVGYVAALSDCCEELGILYIANCCDVPDMAAFESNISNDCNRILVSDSDRIELFRENGAEDVYYVPMAPLIGADRLRGDGAGRVKDKISFIGSLHSNNLYRKFATLPDSIRGFMDGVLTAQTKLYGYSLYDELFDESFWDIMQKVMNANGAMSVEKLKYMVKNYFFDLQVTKLERTSLLQMLSKRFGDDFVYHAQSEETVQDVVNSARVPFGTGLALHYHHTPVNVNITNRARHTGVPQKAWDVLACGGFLLSNYQQDFDGLLVPGEDFVMFGSAGEMLELAEYYLQHEEERERIAKNGFMKVQELHSHEMRLKNIFG